jgi:predicted component of type VI protein secretion system
VSDSEPSVISLEQSLARLHSELSATSQVDDASKRLLKEVLHDIERLLNDRKAAAMAPRSRLESLAVNFDAAHPALSSGLRELADLLARAGL